jgi:hypothetical protein
MPTNLQIRRGLQSALPTGLAGEPLFTTDTKRLYISDGTATNLLQGAATLLTTGAIPFSDANGKLTMNASNLYWDDTDNRLGIGTASPSTALQVGTTSTSNTKIQIASDGFSSTSGLELVRGGSTWNIINNGNFTIQRGGTTYLNVTTTGNVGIGTTTDPGYRLDVNGTTRTSRVDSLTNQSFTIQYQGSGNQTGNLGDNTAQIRLINNLATTSTTGTNHFVSILPLFTPTSGTTIWNAALITPTINQTGGANGITRGLYINPTLTAAADFRAIETSNGKVIFGGTGNVLIGTTTDAGYKLDVVGGDARFNSIRVGLGGNGSDTLSTAVGSGALNANTSGISNTAIGYFTLSLNISGSNNTALGSSALRSSTQANNTAIGSTSLLNLSSGSNNTALGRNAARYIADGSTFLTIAQQSIFIGADARPLADSQTNQIVIGYNAIGLGTNSVVLGNSSVTLTALRGNVLINTTTDAGFRLDVNGTARLNGSTTFGTLGAGTGMFWDNTNNRLGIGISNPAFRFVVSDGTRTGVFNPSSGLNAFTFGTTTNHPVVFVANSNEYARIFTTGNVGIGTNSDAGFRLDVNGSVRATGNIICSSSITATTSVSGATFVSAGLTTNNNGARYILNGSTLSKNWQIANNWNVGGAFEITSSTTAGGSTFTTPNFVIAGATGNVLIGTTTDAGFRLDVNGSVRATGSISAASAIARGTFLNQTLVATANNDVLVGLDIASTFTLGAFTGVSRFPLRIRNAGNTASVFGVSYDGVVRWGNSIESGNNRGILNWDTNRAIVSSGTASTALDLAVDLTTALKLFTSRSVMIQNGGTFTEEASSQLTVNSTTRGFLPPRQTQAQRLAIASPAVGLIVYQTDLIEGLYVYKSVGWTFVI